MSEEAAYNFEHNIIILNIGGTEYTTLRSTLQKYQESLLGAMFETDYRLYNTNIHIMNWIWSMQHRLYDICLSIEYY